MSKNQAITTVPEKQQNLPRDPTKIDQASKIFSAVSDVVSMVLCKKCDYFYL